MGDATPSARNAATLYDRAVALRPDRTALVDGATGDRVSYRELAARVARAGNALADIGVERGDRVALCFPNELTYLDVFLGAMRLGAVPVPINIEVPSETLEYVVADAGAELVVTSARAEVRDRALATAERVEVTTAVAVADAAPETGEADVEVLSLTEAMAAAPATLDAAPTKADDPALQPYTSGSTGRPKGVVLTHGGTWWNATTIARVHLFDAADRGLVAAPLYHKNAMMGAVKPLLFAGGSVVVMDGFDSTAVIEAIDEYDVTYLRGVPAMYKLLVNDEAALAHHDVSSVEWAVSGSASLPGALIERFEATFGAPMGEAYGLTEGGPVVTLSPRWGPRKLGSSGLALPRVETAVVDPDTGEVLSPGETGELLVASPGLGRYHRPPDVDPFERRDGRRFLHTEDLVRTDEQGYHYVVGRLDDMMVVGGENVYPAEVESLLQSHEAVEDVAVVSVPHALKGEAPVAFVVAEGVSEDDLKGYALDRGPAYAHPRRVFFEEALPLAGTAKVDRDALEAEARERVGELG